MVVMKNTRNTLVWITVFALISWLMTVPDFDAFAQGENSIESAQTIEIYTVDDLAAIANTQGGRYRLMNDLDMGSLDWRPIAFSGRLNGAGHTLYNLKVSRTGRDIRETRDGNLKQYDTQFAGLFSVAENAEIVDLNIIGAEIFVENESHCFAAILAGYVNRSHINGCSVSGRVHMINHGVNAGVGGIAGYGCGNFDNCGADVELVFEDRYLDGRCEEFMGGVLACGIGSVTGCRVRIDGWDSCGGYVHNGGLVGMYYDCALGIRAGSVSNNSVSGQISFFENNPDRRAYCKVLIGESLTGPLAMSGNTSDFQSNETMDYSTVLLPEKCVNPNYDEVVTPPGCFEWGNTEHKCRICGYSWIDSYSQPEHTEGEWKIIRDASSESQDLRQKHCEVCGVLLDEENIPIIKNAPKSSSKILYWLILIPLIAVPGVKIIWNIKNKFGFQKIPNNKAD